MGWSVILLSDQQQRGESLLGCGPVIGSILHVVERVEQPFMPPGVPGAQQHTSNCVLCTPLPRDFLGLGVVY